MAIIGMNGSGKTTLAHSLLDHRSGYKLMLVTKGDDIAWSGWKTVKTVEQIKLRYDGNSGKNWRLWPVYERSGIEFAKAFHRVWVDGSWCIYLDEMYHIEALGLKADGIKLLTQGRSKKISVVLGIQRPAWVTRFAMSEPVHVFAFRMGDKRDLVAIADAIGDSYAKQIANLERFQFAYHNKLTLQSRIGTAQDLEEVLAA